MRTIAALVLAVVVWVGAQVLAAPADLPVTPAGGVAVVELDDLPDAEADVVAGRLAERGWTTIPGDACWCLYAPDPTWELGERVSHTIAADLAEEGALRMDLDLLREAEQEWLPAVLLEHGWTSTTSDRCECLYPPVALSA